MRRGEFANTKASSSQGGSSVSADGTLAICASNMYSLSFDRKVEQPLDALETKMDHLSFILGDDWVLLCMI